LRSAGGNARTGFSITIFDSRARGDNWKPRLEQVVVAGGRYGQLGADMREVKLAVTLLEVSIGRMAERLEKIEKRLGMLPADRLESATV